LKQPSLAILVVGLKVCCAFLTMLTLLDLRNELAKYNVIITLGGGA